MQNIPVFLSSDNNYAPLVATTIASILDNTKTRIDFYILDGGITEENREKIHSLKQKFNNFSLEFIKIETNELFKDVKAKNRITLAGFCRLLIPELKPQIKKAIYLDVDIIALNDISKLYNENIEGYIVGAVYDQGDEEYLKKVKNAIETDENSIYFNSGVLLIDCERWRREVKFEDLMKIEEKYRDVRFHNDQDVLNKYFENDFKQLDLKYNVMKENNEIILRHLTGDIKPWFFVPDKNTTIISNISDFWRYAKMTDFYDDFIANIDAEMQSQLIRNWQIEKIRKRANEKN